MKRDLYCRERKWKVQGLLDDIFQVGYKKAIGYISQSKSLKYSENCKNENFIELRKYFIKTDKLTYLDNKSLHKLWVGDKIMIQSILNKNKNLLLKNDWPIDAEKFFFRICKEYVYHNDNKQFYHLINKLFNSRCLFCSKGKNYA